MLERLKTLEASRFILFLTEMMRTDEVRTRTACLSFYGFRAQGGEGRVRAQGGAVVVRNCLIRLWKIKYMRINKLLPGWHFLNLQYLYWFFFTKIIKHLTVILLGHHMSPCSSCMRDLISVPQNESGSTEGSCACFGEASIFWFGSAFLVIMLNCRIPPHKFFSRSLENCSRIDRYLKLFIVPFVLINVTAVSEEKQPHVRMLLLDFLLMMW